VPQVYEMVGCIVFIHPQSAAFRSGVSVGVLYALCVVVCGEPGLVILRFLWVVGCFFSPGWH